MPVSPTSWACLCNRTCHVFHALTLWVKESIRPPAGIIRVPLKFCAA